MHLPGRPTGRAGDPDRGTQKLSLIVFAVGPSLCSVLPGHHGRSAQPAGTRERPTNRIRLVLPKHLVVGLHARRLWLKECIMAVPRRTRGVTVQQALDQVIATLPMVVQQESRDELDVFAQWLGADHPLKEITAERVSVFTKAFGPQAPDPVRRLVLLRSFLTYLRREGLLGRDLSASVRIKDDEWSQTRLQAARPKGLGTVRLTPEGYEQLQAELAALKTERPRLAVELQQAREGEPIDDTQMADWVRHYQGLLETRIGDLESVLKRAEVLQDEEVPEGQAALGSTVVLRDLSNNQTLRYLLVDSPEANPSQGKISVSAPTGQAILGHHEGDEVSVNAPVGTIHYRIESIEGRRGPSTAAA